jgi:hypothetical protein
MSIKQQIEAIEKNTAEIRKITNAIDRNGQSDSDPVSSPSHYAYGSIECIDAIEAMGIGIEFCQGNAVKYLWRLGHKNKPLEDARKAQWYINRLVRILEQKANAAGDAT